MKTSLIAAIGKNRELGKDNDLIWKIPEDLKRFREITRGHPIIMGRKTWDSLPTKPLPSRVNIIISRMKSSIAGKLPDVYFESSLEDAIKLAKTKENEEIFIIGGGQIFQQAIEKGLVDKLYLTIVDATSEADIYFPEYSGFKKVVFEKVGEFGGHKYKFIDIEK